MGEFNDVPSGAADFVASDPNSKTQHGPEVRVIDSENRHVFTNGKRNIDFKLGSGNNVWMESDLVERARLLFMHELPDYMAGSIEDHFNFFEMLSEADSESPEVAKEIMATIRDLPKTQFTVMNYLMNERKISDWPNLLPQRLFESKIKAFSKMPTGDANWNNLLAKAEELFSEPKDK